MLNGLRLMLHVTEKGFQAGAVLGIAIVLPIVAYRRSRKVGSLAGASPDLLRTLGKSALWGAGITTVMGLGKIASMPSDERADGLQDRAYRLHYNTGQNRTDLFSQVGMAVGGTAAMWLVSPAAMVVLGGAAAGSAAGVAAHVLTSRPSTKVKD